MIRNGKLGNYSVTTNNGVLSVTAATLVGTADNQSRLYGQNNPVFTASYTGFVNGENTSLLSGTLSGRFGGRHEQSGGNLSDQLSQGRVRATTTFSM